MRGNDEAVIYEMKDSHSHYTTKTVPAFLAVCSSNDLRLTGGHSSSSKEASLSVQQEHFYPLNSTVKTLPSLARSARWRHARVGIPFLCLTDLERCSVGPGRGRGGRRVVLGESKIGTRLPLYVEGGGAYWSR